MRFPGLAAAVLLGLPAAALAEERPPSVPPVFAADLDVVNVTVTVRDAAGHLVGGLRPEDFVVLEDGRPQAIQVFGRAVDPGHDETLALDLGLLMDTSQSMLQELKLSQEAATRFLQAIPRARELITIFFDQDIRLSRYDSENQQGLFDRIAQAKGGGNTALYDAIAVYLSRVAGGTGRKVLVVFTDGEDSTSALSLTDLIRLVRGSAVTIYPIAFTGHMPTGSRSALRSRGFLNEIADLTGGQVFRPAASRDLAGIYQKILEELSGQYVLGFVSDSTRHDGKFRRLKVQVRRDGLRVRHREGYFGSEDAGD
jgi:Ca-activated chloride channel family protein